MTTNVNPVCTTPDACLCSDSGEECCCVEDGAKHCRHCAARIVDIDMDTGEELVS